jgi:hypothetical protein
MGFDLSVAAMESTSLLMDLAGRTGHMPAVIHEGKAGNDGDQGAEMKHKKLFVVVALELSAI